MAGSTRSFKGALAYYNYFYGFGETSRTVDMIECTGIQDKGSECWEYSAFINCCTWWGVNQSYGCVYSPEFMERFPNYDTCVEYGGNYARCHPNQESGSCSNSNPEWSHAKTVDPPESFFKGLGIMSDNERSLFIERLEAIDEYPYDQSIFNKDCTSFEYPDPTSKEYASAFIENGVIPLIVAAPPSDTIMTSPGSGLANTMASYDYNALRMSEYNCPGLEWDPWTTYLCNRQGSGGCYAPDSYDTLYPTKSTWKNQRFWEEKYGCSDEECAKQWWSQCYDVEYGFPISKIREHGAEIHYQLMDAKYDAHTIVRSIMEIINTAMAGKNCLATTTTTTTTTVTTTTDAPTTTTIVTDDFDTIASVGTDRVTDNLLTTEDPAYKTDESGLPPTQKPNLDQTTEDPNHRTDEGALPPTQKPNNETETDETTTTTTTTTTVPPDLPPVPPTQPPATEEDGGSMGVIIGSAVGGAVVAAGAVVGGLMAKGIIPFNVTSSPTTTPPDVEAENITAEREQMAEIDADMFV